MCSKVGSAMDFNAMCSMFNLEIKDLKKHINWLENQRISSMLKSLQEDETRLKNCIEEIQDFHRDLFVLPSTEEKPADPEDGKTNCDYYVTEPVFSENKPISAIETLKLCLREVNAKIAKCEMNKENIPENNLADESNEVKGESSDFVDELCNIKNESDDVNKASYESHDVNTASYESHDVNTASYESHDVNTASYESHDVNMASYESHDVNMASYESHDVKDRSDSSNYCDSYTSKSESDGSSYDDSYMSETDENKDKFIEEDDNMAKELLLDILADKEEEVSNLLLDLISRFASFQNNLQIASTKGSLLQIGNIYPQGSNVTINSLLKTLRQSVLKLDQTILNIYKKYSQMLENFKTDNNSKT